MRQIVQRFRLLSAAALALTLAACSSGNNSSGGLLDPNNPGGGSTTNPTTLTLTCPPNAAPGIANTGYSAFVTGSSSAPVPMACVTVTSDGGTISPPPSTTCPNSGTGGNLTNTAGRFAFTLTPAANVVADTVYTLTAATTTERGEMITGTCQTTVRADTFQFTAPAAGTPITVGNENREPVRFQWTRSSQTPGGAQGVSGTVTLQVNGQARIVLNDDPLNQSQNATVNTSATNAGDFERPVSVFSNASGQSTITAREQETGRTATLVVQFVDAPGEINLDATPLVVQTSPSSTRFSELLVTVLNQSGDPITGVDVDFNLVQSASGNVNEKVFPQRQTTNASGQARSRYEAGPTAGTARVQVQVEGGGLSNVREITVQTPPP